MSAAQPGGAARGNDDPSSSPRALITGASSGIGAAFARTLAARGYATVLVARRRERLVSLAAELESAGSESTPLVADLASDDLADVEEYLHTHHVDLLVNNAGFGAPGNVADQDIGTQTDMINLHVLATYRLMRAALPSMIARNRGAIINVSSIAAFLTNPGGANYSATKAYLNSITRAMAIELEDTGVRVQALCPGFTRTEFHQGDAYRGYRNDRVPGFLWMSAEKVVERSLEGLERGQTVVVPGWINKMLTRVIGSPLAMRTARAAKKRLNARPGQRAEST